MDTQEQILIRDLGGTDIFAGLSHYDLEQIAKYCSLRNYQAGEHCAVQGKTTDELGIIKEGKVAIEIRLGVAPYTQTLNIATLTRGNTFAWSALVEPHVLDASVRCIGKVEVVYIKASDLQGIFRNWPSIEHVVMKNLVAIMSSRLRDSWGQLTRLVAEMIKQGR